MQVVLVRAAAVGDLRLLKWEEEQLLIVCALGSPICLLLQSCCCESACPDRFERGDACFRRCCAKFMSFCLTKPLGWGTE